jgi:PST family polysaccharide transporter
MGSNNKSLGKTAKHGVVWSFLREGVTEVILFPVSMVVARLLTPAEFGVAAAVLFFVQLAARLADLGFNAALVRAKELTEDQTSSVFWATLGIGMLCFLSLVAASPFVARFYQYPDMAWLLRVGALSFLIVPFGSVSGALMVRDNRFRELSIVDWCYCLTFAVLSVTLASLGFSYWSLTLARVASHVSQAAARLWFAGWRMPRVFSRRALGDMLSFGLGMQAKRLLDYAANNVDNLVVGKAMGLTALGFYDKAFSTMNRFLARLNTGGPQTMFRIFAMMQDDYQRFGRAYRRVMLGATLFGFPFLAVLVVSAPSLMVVLFGANWLPAAAPFQVLGIAGMFRMINSYASAAIQAFGKVWLEVLSQIAYVALIAGGVFVARGRGVLGAAEAVFVATAVMSVLMHVVLRKVTGLTWGQIFGPLAPGLACAASTAAITVLVHTAAQKVFGTLPPVVSLGLQLGVGAVWGLVFLVTFPHAGMREVVTEGIQDLTPASVRRHPWVRKWLEVPAAKLPAVP